MNDFNAYLKSSDLSSKFSCELGSQGGYVNFKNSGSRGSVKEFTVSLSSLLQGLYDIKNNLSYFSHLTNYIEKEWRDAGSEYFKDLALNSIITVQTKPCFTTLSKLISWANNVKEDKFDDSTIDLNINSIAVAIQRTEKLISSYTPFLSAKDVDKKKIFTGIRVRAFAHDVITYLYKNYQQTLLDELSDIYVNEREEQTRSLPFLKGIFLISDNENEKEKLCSGKDKTERFFDQPIQYDSEFLYISNQWYGDDRQGMSVGNLKIFLAKFFPQYLIKKEDDAFVFLHKKKQNLLSLHQLPKPFILLAGISGTGKTRFVRQQAELIGSLEENYQLVSVRPDWHEPSDLLGYISRLSSHGAEFIVTDVVKFMMKAWLSSLNTIESNVVDNKTVYTPIYKSANEVKPYWLCLDEMNLAPVEQYFADYLSVLETRKWENQQYTCDALLTASIFSQLGNHGLLALRKKLGIEDAKFDDVWQYVQQSGICIPFNLMVAGTVNMDETTHGFSRKVIDRALTFDFGEFFPNNYKTYFNQQSQPKKLGFANISAITNASQLAGVVADNNGELSINFLNEVNGLLKGTAFELAYRALNELLVSVYCFSPKTPAELQAVWDDFLMCKVLPRIEGDEDKLMTGEDSNILAKLETLLDGHFNNIWPDGADRLDLLSESKIDKNDVMVPCRSKIKLKQMQSKLNSAGFTSYWP